MLLNIKLNVPENKNRREEFQLKPKQKVGKALSGNVSEIAILINKMSIQDVVLE